MKKVLSTILLLLLFFPIHSHAEERADVVKIFFGHNSYAVRSEFGQNTESIAQLKELINKSNEDSQIVISKINVHGYTSPEGDVSYNKKLAKKRADAICEYLANTLSVSRSLIECESSGIDWDGLCGLVKESDMQWREDVLKIIYGVPEETWRRVKPTDRWLTLVDSRNKHLMDLRGGTPYRYMYAKYYTQLRFGSVAVFYTKNDAQSSTTPNSAVNTTPTSPSQEANATGASRTATTAGEVGQSTSMAPNSGVMSNANEAIKSANNETDEASNEAEADKRDEAQAGEEDEKRPLRFALKTNLLYDLMLAPNIELEIPIKDRWSVAGEWIFPWWVSGDNGYALQLLAGQVEGRYWFGERENRPQLTGWFAGLYAGGGYYDLQWDDNGYQGDFYIAAGLSGGYAHTINKSGSLRMEYSLGIGYLQTDYSYYEGKENNKFLVWQNDGTYSWFGPTKAEVSLVWFADWKRGGKR